jgi:orotate phosphoribosyltransferase
MERNELAQAIYRASHLTGQFRLRSGATASEYFDKYLFESDPALLGAIVEHLAPLMPADIDALAGLELGGVPIATMLAQQTGLPAYFVRKEQKLYGTCRLVEDGPIAGQLLLIVEDVVSSGGQISLSTRNLRGLGATVDHALCVIDRESGGPDALAPEDVKLSPLFLMSELLDQQTPAG